MELLSYCWNWNFFSVYFVGDLKIKRDNPAKAASKVSLSTKQITKIAQLGKSSCAYISSILKAYWLTF
jgi:hypothetical protein